VARFQPFALFGLNENFMNTNKFCWIVNLWDADSGQTKVRYGFSVFYTGQTLINPHPNLCPAVISIAHPVGYEGSGFYFAVNCDRVLEIEDDSVSTFRDCFFKSLRAVTWDI
jgi:hypothetical protein